MRSLILQLQCCLLFLSYSQAQISFIDTSNILVYPNVSSGAPIGIADMNGDGLDDIITLDNTSHLYIQYQGAPGQFTGFDGGLMAGSQWSMCIADVDRNGYNDIFTGGAYNGLKLLKANDTGTDYSLSILPGSIFLQGSNFVDIDNDNHVDIFACHDDGLSRPYRNDGEGNFTLDYGLISAESTFPSDNSGNYGSIWTDYDNDNDLDLYISKCRLGVEQPTDGRRTNLLFQNDGMGNFTDVASMAGMLPFAQSWATDFADYDNDGDLDAFIINHSLTCQLRENQGNGTFVNMSSSAGILPALEAAGFGLQAKFEDFDNDGYVDLLVTTFGQNHVLFRNNGNKTFTPLPDALSPFDRIHSTSTGDLNNDGFIDIYASYGFSYNGTSNTTPDRLYFNAGNDNNYFKVLLHGNFSNANGIGARVEIYGEWGKQIREVRSGESYGIMTSYINHFGIGTASSIDSLIVRWPSGVVDVVINPDINQQFDLVEGAFCSQNADFSYAASQLFVNFQDLSNVSTDEWLWDFGDGNTSTEQNPSHQYETPDVYEVCLQIGGTCITCQEVALNCNIPDASFGIEQTGFTVDFTDQSSSNPSQWFWTFGEGNASSFEQNPSHTFSEPGTYVVCLIAANDCGETQFCDFITVACDIPEAAFEVEQNELEITFTDISAQGATAWFWNFGDGNVSDEQNPMHTYEMPGTYTVCFEINNECGTETTCEELLVSCNPPSPGFSSAIDDLEVQFTDESSDDTETWAWDFGDGNTSTEPNPIHEYSEPGEYEVCLIVNSLCGFDQICETINITCITPEADFITNADQLSVNFGDISSNAPTAWQWTFGDGASSMEEFPQHTYNEPGTYEVCLTASNDCGSDEICQTISVDCAAPMAGFMFTANELALNFQDVSLDNPSIWAWTFGDGNTSGSQNPQHSYELPGTYEVCLTVSSICGSSTSCQMITVGCLSPIATFSHTDSDLQISFQDNSPNSPSTWFWTFGDGASSNSQNPDHTYNQPGIYEVCLTASNICGETQSCEQITVSCSAPQALFGYVSSDLDLTFNDLSSNNPTSWLWDFGDGNMSSEQNPQHTYDEPGSYEVCFLASSICGQSQRCELVTVNCAAPVPSFSIVYNDLMVNFIDQSSNEPESWLWDFGDGMGSSEQNPQHTYSTPGNYQVCLTASSICGSNMVCFDIEVSCAPPESGFDYEPTGLTVSFTDLSDNDPESWLWDFGDGTFSINQNPSHTYQSDGLKTVCLITTSMCGADTLCEEINLILDNIDETDLAQQVSLYPNPGRDQLQLAFTQMEGIAKFLSIYDAAGKRWTEAYELNPLNEIETLDISYLPPGVYWLQIKTDKGFIRKRFVKI
jgi:PKD repeat protein